MLARAMRGLVVMAWLVSSLLAYQVVERENASAPLTSVGVVTVTDWTGTGTSTQLRAALVEFAQRERITVAQEVPDRRRGVAVRHLYLTDGDPDALEGDQLGALIGDFGETASSVTHPIAEAGLRSPVGNWVVFGRVEGLQSTADFFRAHGATTWVSPALAPPPAVPLSLWSDHRTTLTVMSLLMACTAGALVVARTRRYAIERLHGAPAPSVMGREIAPVLGLWIISGAVTLSLEAALTVARYDGAGIHEFLWNTAALAAVFLTAALCGFAASFALVGMVDMLPALKGQTASTALAVCTYAIRVTSVLVALGLSADAATLLADAARRSTIEAPLRALGDTSVIGLGNAYTDLEQTALGERVGTWLRHLDADGTVILALQHDQSTPAGSAAGRPVLLVNRAFLEAQPIPLAAEGQRATVSTGRLTVVVPQSQWPQRKSLVSGVIDGLRPSLGSAAGAAPQVVQAHPDMTLSTLTVPRPTGEQRPGAIDGLVEDPVVVVTPEPLTGVYTAGATAGQVLLTDPTGALRELDRDPSVARYVRSITPVAEQALAANAQQERTLYNTLFGSAVAFLVVLMAGVAGVLVNTRKNAQRAFAKHLHGWRVPQIYPGLIAAESALFIVLSTWIPWQVHQQREALAPMNDLAPIPGGLPSLGIPDAIAMSSLALITTGGFCVTLFIAHRRIIRHGISEA